MAPSDAPGFCDRAPIRGRRADRPWRHHSAAARLGPDGPGTLAGGRGSQRQAADCQTTLAHPHEPPRSRRPAGPRGSESPSAWVAVETQPGEGGLKATVRPSVRLPGVNAGVSAAVTLSWCARRHLLRGQMAVSYLWPGWQAEHVFSPRAPRRLPAGRLPAGRLKVQAENHVTSGRHWRHEDERGSV